MNIKVNIDGENMLLRELFDREFLYESKNENKLNKIFYKFDINIVKKKEEEIPQNDQQSPADQNQTPDQNAGTEPPAPETVDNVPLDQGSMDQGPTDLSNPDMGGETTPTISADDLPPMPVASVVTEDDKKDITINDDNNIVRKLEGELVISKEDVDNIQTIEDLITKLTEEKVDGVTILDEFTGDIVQVLANPQTQNQISTMIDKESMIYVEMLYGKKREDSVGIRIIKRKNSDMVSTSMMIDNKIINAPYNKGTIDGRIVDIRNGEYDETEKK